MPATVRDILLMIRAKEEATRSLGNISNAMRRVQAQAQAAAARGRAAALRAQAAQAKLQGATKTQIQTLLAAASAEDQHANSLLKANRHATELGHTMQNVGHVTQTTGIVMAATGAATLYALSQAVQVAGEWDRQVRLTMTQVDKRFKPTLASLGDIGLRVSRDIAVPFEEIQGALFDVFSSTEANLPQAEALLRAFAKAAVAGQTDIQTASRATIGIMNSFKIPFKDVNKVLDLQFQLVQEGVGTYEEWASRLGTVTPSAARAGQSLETMAAALSTATRQGMNSARASTSVARAFDAMSNPKTEKALKRIGVASRDAKGNFRPMVDVLADWRKQLEKMPKEKRVANILDVLKGAGGTIEARRFLQNILLTKGGLELFQAQIKEFATDKGAFQRAYEDMSKSIAAKTQILHNAWMQLKLAIGQALLPLFSQLVNGLQKLVGWFNNLPAGVKSTIAQFILWGGVLSIVGGAVTIVVGALLTLAGVVAAAGTAIFPIIAIFAGVALGIAAVVAGAVALGGAMIAAYQKSENFRALVQSIWEFLKAAGGALRDFATGVWNSFSSQVLPQLRNLWTVIETQLLPAIQGFVSWARGNLLPIVSQVGSIVQNQLANAFKTVASAIRTDAIPAIQELIAWWQQNKAWILPTIQVLAEIAGVFAVTLGNAIAISIASLGAWIKIVSWAGRTAMSTFTAVKVLAINAFSGIVGVIQRVISWFKNLGNQAKSSMTAGANAVKAGISNIKGYFAGAASWLISAGRDLVMGFVNGIRGMIGNAASAAADMAKRALGAAKGALGISSPSKAFKDIGIQTIRGWVNGVRDSTTLKQLQNAYYKVADAVMKSIREADISTSARRSMSAKWSKRLTNTIRNLTAQENKRLTLQTKLAAAEKSVNDQIKARDDLASKIKETLGNSADLSTLADNDKKSAAGMVQAMQKRLQAMLTFQTNLRNLAKRGLDKETIAELAQQGVDQAGATVQALVNGTNYDLQQLSKLQQQIRAVASATGTNVAGDLYNAGIKAGQGLVKGIQSQISAITKSMTAVANALVAQIKKELGIKSPSTVFDRLGVNTAQGYINGYVRRMNEEAQALAAATSFTFKPTAPAFGNGTLPPGPGSPGYNGSGGKTINNHITVNTREIDPRKTAADLGWELSGRM